MDLQMIILIGTCTVILIAVQIYTVISNIICKKNMQKLSPINHSTERVSADTIKEIFDTFYCISVYETNGRYTITHSDSNIIILYNGHPKLFISHEGYAILTTGTDVDMKTIRIVYNVECKEEMQKFDKWLHYAIENCIGK